MYTCKQYYQRGCEINLKVKVNHLSDLENAIAMIFAIERKIISRSGLDNEAITLCMYVCMYV